MEKLSMNTPVNDYSVYTHTHTHTSDPVTWKLQKLDGWSASRSRSGKQNKTKQEAHIGAVC